VVKTKKDKAPFRLLRSYALTKIRRDARTLRTLTSVGEQHCAIPVYGPYAADFLNIFHDAFRDVLEALTILVICLMKKIGNWLVFDEVALYVRSVNAF